MITSFEAQMNIRKKCPFFTPHNYHLLSYHLSQLGHQSYNSNFQHQQNTTTPARAIFSFTLILIRFETNNKTFSFLTYHSEKLLMENFRVPLLQKLRHGNNKQLPSYQNELVLETEKDRYTIQDVASKWKFTPTLDLTAFVYLIENVISSNSLLSKCCNNRCNICVYLL